MLEGDMGGIKEEQLVPVLGTHEVKPQMSLHSSHRTADGTGCFLEETDLWLSVALKMLPH